METARKLVTEEPVVESEESRAALAKMVMKLFQLWKLSTAEQLDLLGLSPRSRSLLAKYAKGEALPLSRDTLDRVGWLLAIHKALRMLYPQNENFRHSWVKQRNSAFENHTPLEIMCKQGIIGIARVSRYLDYVRGR